MTPFYPYTVDGKELWKINTHESYPANQCSMSIHGDIMLVINVTTNDVVANAEYYNYSNASGVAYASMSALKDAVAGFFVKATDALVAQLPNLPIEYMNPTSTIATYHKTTTSAPFYTSAIVSSTDALATPFELLADVNVTTISCFVPVTVGANVNYRIGIFKAGANNSATSWLGEVVWQSIASGTTGSVAGNFFLRNETVNKTLKKGIYFLCMSVNGFVGNWTPVLAFFPTCLPLTSSIISVSNAYPNYQVSFAHGEHSYVDNQPSTLTIGSQRGWPHAFLINHL